MYTVRDPVILYLIGLNYYGLLKPFFYIYIDVYEFAMWFYITSGTKSNKKINGVLEQLKHPEL